MLALILQRNNRASHGGRCVSAEWGGEERRGPPPPMAAFLTAASLALLCCVPAAPAGPTLTRYHHPLHAPRCSSLSVLTPTSTHPPSHRRNNLLPAQARRRQRQRAPAAPPAARGPRRPGLGRHLLARDGARHHVWRRRSAVLVGRGRGINRSQVEAAAARVGRRGAAGALLVGGRQHALHWRRRRRGLSLAPPAGWLLHGEGRAGQQAGRGRLVPGKHHGASLGVGSKSRHRAPPSCPRPLGRRGGGPSPSRRHAELTFAPAPRVITHNLPCKHYCAYSRLCSKEDGTRKLTQAVVRVPVTRPPDLCARSPPSVRLRLPFATPPALLQQERSLLCSGSLDGFIRLWDVRGLPQQYGKPASCLLAYRAHDRGVVAADVSRWCGLLFTAGLDHTVKVGAPCAPIHQGSWPSREPRPPSLPDHFSPQQTTPFTSASRPAAFTSMLHDAASGPALAETDPPSKPSAPPCPLRSPASSYSPQLGLTKGAPCPPPLCLSMSPASAAQVWSPLSDHYITTFQEHTAPLVSLSAMEGTPQVSLCAVRAFHTSPASHRIDTRTPCSGYPPSPAQLRRLPASLGVAQAPPSPLAGHHGGRGWRRVRL